MSLDGEATPWPYSPLPVWDPRQADGNRRGFLMRAGSQRCHCTPVKVSRSSRSFQFGRASAPTMPQTVQTMRGPKAGTATASPKASTFITASRWQSWQVTESERTPFARMLASVIGGPR
jgi:hypothetical protein